MQKPIPPQPLILPTASWNWPKFWRKKPHNFLEILKGSGKGANRCAPVISYQWENNVVKFPTTDRIFPANGKTLPDVFSFCLCFVKILLCLATLTEFIRFAWRNFLLFLCISVGIHFSAFPQNFGLLWALRGCDPLLLVVVSDPLNLLNPKPNGILPRPYEFFFSLQNSSFLIFFYAPLPSEVAHFARWPSYGMGVRVCFDRASFMWFVECDTVSGDSASTNVREVLSVVSWRDFPHLSSIAGNSSSKTTKFFPVRLIGFWFRSYEYSLSVPLLVLVPNRLPLTFP